MPIGDIECRRHFVAVFRFKSTCRETNLLHHVRIDDRETFLLPAAYKHGAIDFHLIDIYQILIERSTSYIILARKLVMGTYTSLLLYQFLYGIACGRRRLLQVFYIQLLGLTCLSALLGYRHLL